MLAALARIYAASGQFEQATGTSRTPEFGAG